MSRVPGRSHRIVLDMILAKVLLQRRQIMITKQRLIGRFNHLQVRGFCRFIREGRQCRKPSRHCCSAIAREILKFFMSYPRLRSTHNFGKFTPISTPFHFTGGDFGADVQRHTHAKTGEAGFHRGVESSSVRGLGQFFFKGQKVTNPQWGLALRSGRAMPFEPQPLPADWKAVSLGSTRIGGRTRTRRLAGLNTPASA